jgi:2-haloacid dehalogenase
MNSTPSIKALGFDVFGTVVDWRNGVIRDASAVGKAKGIERDWARFADAWRALYGPSMEEVRSGRRPWTKLDVLHRESLDKLAPEYGLEALSKQELDDLNKAWHRLDPWPDAVAGLTRLKTEFTLFTLSNGNVALMVDMAKRAGLPWDAILGAEVTRHYKPQPECYLMSAEFLGLRPDECMLVAAHAGDLRAAGAVGLHTAFVSRPDEFGGARQADAPPPGEFDFTARDFLDLANQLGC